MNVDNQLLIFESAPVKSNNNSTEIGSSITFKGNLDAINQRVEVQQ